MHVAIIMDGNGRWANQRNIPSIEGHRAGAKTAKKIIEHALQCDVNYLTLYTFSSENWKRPQVWLQDFFKLFKWSIDHELKDLLTHQIRLRIIGDISGFPYVLQHLLRSIQDQTASHTKMTVCLALGYGGRDELIRAIKKIDNVRELTEEMFCAKLDTSDMPDPDLLIRTSGEKRLSNFLLWQLAYTELYFSKKLWPDFSCQDFDEALQDFDQRQRRFGA